MTCLVREFNCVRFDELRDLIRSQKNSMKIKDITKVQTGVYDSRKQDLQVGVIKSSWGLSMDHKAITVVFIVTIVCLVLIHSK